MFLFCSHISREKKKLVGVQTKIIMSDAAWAWEGLRRNPDYNKAWARHGTDPMCVSDKVSGLRHVRLNKPYFEAETYGLLAFADPELPASEAPVFWRPNLLLGTLEVRLAVAKNDLSDSFSLGSLKCCPTVLDGADGLRHIRFGGHKFWIQLVTPDLIELKDETRVVVTVTLNGAFGTQRRLKTIEHLLSLHQMAEGEQLDIKRAPSRDKLLEGLIAWDVQHGQENRTDKGCGSLRDIAIAIFGEARITQEWTSNRSLKNHAVRARNRGKAFVMGGYRDLLHRAAF